MRTAEPLGGHPQWVPAIAVGLLVLLAGPPSYSEEIRVSGVVQGRERTADLDERYHSGAQYVSLLSLVDQFGGGYSLLSSRTRIDLAGSTVWVQYNDRRVNAFRVFSLSRPILRLEDDVMIATDDLPSFLSNAFGIDARAESAPNVAEVELTVPDSTETDPAREAEAETGQTPKRPGRARFIVVDPGHGGFDHGIEGKTVSEHELTLSLAEALREAARDANLPPVVLTRKADMAMSVDDRVRIAAEAGDSVYVSLHAGISFSRDVRGSAILFPQRQGGTRAGSTLQKRSARLARVLSEQLESEAVLPHRGTLSTDLHVESELRAPAVMIEVGCLSNSADEAVLQNEEALDRLAAALASGLHTFLNPAESARETAGI